MPRYNFKCKNCDEIFSEIVKFSEINTKTCIKCGEKAKKIFTPPKNISITGTLGELHL